MKKYLVSTYGEMHFAITARSPSAAKLHLNRMFSPTRPSNPLCSVSLTKTTTCLGFEIFEPQLTRILDHEDDPRGVLEH